MVTERELVQVPLTQDVIERAAAHLRAQRAGVILLAHIKDDLLDISFDAGVRYIEFLAQLAHGREVHALEAQLYRHGLKLERLRVRLPQAVEREEQDHAVLPAGHADSHAVARLYHAVIVHGAADSSGKVTQCVSHGFSPSAKQKIEFRFAEIFGGFQSICEL